jgi:hypothetical protein
LEVMKKLRRLLDEDTGIEQRHWGGRAKTARLSCQTLWIQKWNTT